MPVFLAHLVCFRCSKALDPPDDPREADSEVDVWGKGRPLSQTAVPRTWPQVGVGRGGRLGCSQSERLVLQTYRAAVEGATVCPRIHAQKK